MTKRGERVTPHATGGDGERVPILSVVVPVHDGAPLLERCLAALMGSQLPRERWELIVVDDASSDDSPLVAARYADVIVRLSRAPRGPAYARNRGFECSRGRYVAFIDADVCVHADTLSRMVAVFERHSDVGAVFGSYDGAPPAGGFVSQYRNLLRHFIHVRFRGDSDVFWAACGAVRSTVFSQAGMYDEWRFPRPQVEGVELGYRIRRLGHRILLDPEMQACHLKAWTLGSLLLAETRDRGVPRARVLGAEQHAPGRDSDRLRDTGGHELLAGSVAMLTLVGTAATGPWRWTWGSLMALAILIAGNRPLVRFFLRQRGAPFAIGALLLHQLSHAAHGVAAAWGWLLRHAIGEPRPEPVIEAFAEVGVETWPPLPVKRDIVGNSDVFVPRDANGRRADVRWPDVGTERVHQVRSSG